MAKKRRRDGINVAAVDEFTIAHGAVGIALGLFTDIEGPGVVALALGWEIVERPLKARFPALFPHPSQDTPQNAIVDAGAMMLGWYGARAISRAGEGEAAPTP